MTLKTISVSNANMVPVSEIQFLLTKLMSEASELAHACSKLLEFGIDDAAHMEVDQQGGLDKVLAEYNDVLSIAQMLTDVGVSIQAYPRLILAKKKKVEHYMAKSRQLGMLSKGRTVTADRLRTTRCEFQAMLNMSNIKIVPESRWGSTPCYSVKHTRARLTLHLAKFPNLLRDLEFTLGKFWRVMPKLKFELHGEHDPETGHYDVHLKVIYSSKDPMYLDSLLDYWIDSTAELKSNGVDISVTFDNEDPTIEDAELALLFPKPPSTTKEVSNDD